MPSLKPRCLWLTVAVFVTLQSPAARAWSNHTLCTWQATTPLGHWGERTVTAETLADFLTKEADRLPKMLADEEQWAQATVPFYPPRPAALAFQAPHDGGGDASALKRAFLQAIRANADMPLALYLQRPPGTAVAPERVVPWPSLSILKSMSDLDANSLERIDDGATVRVADVVATASNEPDYGLDIGLWQDNGTQFGALYGYGPQPFGNPRLDYGSQAPFHMGFYHESGIVYRAAPYLQHTYPEARIHLYMTLSRFAFAQGHAYWGWRFAGWAVHYVQDLAQPYHARVLPGVNVTRMLLTSVLDMAGVHGPKTAALNRVTNRHTVLENYQYRHMAAAYRQGALTDPLLVALRDTTDDPSLPRLQPAALRTIVTAQSADAADALDGQLERSFSAHYVTDPDTDLAAVPDLDMDSIARQAPVVEQERLSALVAARMRQVGRDTRAVLRAVDPQETAEAAAGAPRP
ncbi:phospholipase [Nitrospirillum iridis]|uniref:Phospholipase n=1 Tax=Nitrospirillum iridis TaxID=765888 RepID=A0A7X0B3H0_9PROT|nr:phospholipase [Nitrospirillum iridis]MBB6255048.1 hypothetical protein [Nitrospirillum iridis]